MLKIIGMGESGYDITGSGIEAVSNADIVVVDSKGLAISEFLISQKITAIYLDEILIERTDLSIAEYLLSLCGNVCYCVMGNGYDNNIVNTLSALNARFSVVHGVSKGARVIAYAMSKEQKSDTRQALQKYHADTFIKREIQQFEHNIPIIIYDIDNQNLDKVKNKLSDLYSPATKVVFDDGMSIKDITIMEINAGTVYIAGASFLQRSRYSFGDLLEIIRRLRDPDGCQWDREQTHDSIKSNAIEEAYELVEAIELNDTAKMLEESGDVLLQGLFHATIAEDADEFNVSDVISALSHKLLSRHTHIFGDNKANDAESALAFWEKAKAKEKGQMSVADKIEHVPATFSALMYANKVQKIIKKTGFDFASVDNAVDKIYEELDEFKATTNKASEAGDILFAVVNVLRMLDIDPEIALNNTTKKFIKRFNYVEKRAKENNVDIYKCDVDIMEEWYQEYKKLYEDR